MSDVRVKTISAQALGLDVNTSVGLTSNGSVHPTTEVSASGEVTVINFFTRSGEKLPRSYYEKLLESEHFVLQGLDGEPRILMEARFAEIRRYLELTAGK